MKNCIKFLEDERGNTNGNFFSSPLITEILVPGTQAATMGTTDVAKK